MNFAPITWLDVFALAGSLRTRDGLFKADDERLGLRLLPIRGPRKGTEESDEDFVGHVTSTKWVELTNTISRIRRIGDGVLGGVDLGLVFLEMLDPGATLPWRTETTPYFKRWQRAVLPVRTNPATAMFAGLETSSPGQGWLTIVNVLAPHCAVNLGETPRVHLVLDWRRKDAEV